MKKIFFITFLSFLSIMSVAQNCSFTLTGPGESTDTKGTLAVLRVTIKEIRKSATAGNNCEFISRKLCPGKYTVITTYVDYDTLNATIDADSSVTENFTVQHDIISLKQVIITGAPEKKIS